ncbi:transcriptional regulator Medusa [Talaromyces stipitatus ATCC 10500]|uniref:Transcriptional regulator Medusa n=1 Tax=Talaromyces stipitatus (strain ATCC 10500 / CBS 375.48 / QM 6759 / NRRL 1006) TaxID=441959 RepID=B8M3L8_TALSN|nr:transcriptional regulator Medusa [Talaromyces stipitatus ATCC 10500]EED22390.1 transcriptional regulator Medusa [Talaromyces stipitatus ATCC 10500]
MSSFQRSQNDLEDFNDQGSSFQENSFTSNYGQLPFMNPMYATSQEDFGSPESDTLQYGPSHSYAGSATFEDAQSPGFDTPVSSGPEVVSFAPQRGSEGTQITVRVILPFDLHSTARVFISFGSRQCECSFRLVDNQNSQLGYFFSTHAPNFAFTRSPSFDVPLQLVINNPSAGAPLVLQIGTFSYEQYLQAPVDDSRKRSFSAFPESASYRPAKRHSSHELEAKPVDHPTHTRSASYTSFAQTPVNTSAFPAPFDMENSPRLSMGGFSTASPSLQPPVPASSPMIPTWSPSVSVTDLSVVNTPSTVNMPIPQSQNPTLIRTSTLHHGHNLGASQPFNPYAMYPTKAVLELNGELDSMALNWTPQEKAAKRRLVQFTRSQNGSTIHADFKPITPEERTPNSICISCILWDGKDECFVTSVDTIYLLESLVAVRFTVEEKNRIRRNLEGFRPLTVSKTKADSEDFFKVIMGFPAPKPRNIEKDVKVFPWKILCHALKKIIGKYSASYSSTAGALPGSLSASHSMSSDLGTESLRASSPQSIAESTASNAYPVNFSSATFAPSLMPVTSGLDSEFAVTLSGPTPGYPATMGAPYQFEPNFQPDQALMNQPSWDFTTSSQGEDFNYMNIPYTMG